MKKRILLLIALLIPAIAVAMSSKMVDQRITTAPGIEVEVHDASGAYFTITNFGQVGSMSGAYDDPDWEGIVPGAEFPAASDIDYLFIGALWIGAEVDTVDGSGNPVLDTLVSVGFDGWWGIDELLPPPTREESLWEEEVFGDQEFFAVYYDTTTNPSYVSPDPIDQRNHLPLGLKITQNSFCWSSPGYNEIFVINYFLENISGRDLHNAWAGFYYDGDVYHSSEMPFGPEQGAGDDICGFIEYGGNGIAWLADNDGQPYDGEYESRSPVDVMCATLIGSTEPGLQTNFNWWMSNINSDLDWGPQLQINFDRWGVFPCGGRGTPCGDKAKYRIMSNGEHDYDQIWSALDHSHEGWIEMPANAADIANGYDTRFLLSFGPMQIASGETEIVTVAYFGARDLHVDPLNYEINLRYATDDSLSIARYYQNLDFSDMRAKHDSAFSFYSQGYANVPPGPPHDFLIDHWNDSHIALKWNPIARPNLQEYRIYRGTEPGVYDPEKITPDGFADSVFVDYNVEDNTVYYYIITSFSLFGMEGGSSDEIFINSGQPQTPAGLSATSEQVRIDLTWDENSDSDLYGYIVYKARPGQDFAIIDTALTNSYSDGDLYVGRLYRYKITAVDTFGNESFYSEAVSIYAMGLDSGIILVNCNRPNGNPDYDSMLVFYENLLQGYQYYLIDYPPDNMPLLASFSTVVFCKEHITGYRHFDVFDNNSLLADYLEAGGNLLLAGTRQLTPNNSFFGTYHFNPSGFVFRYFNVEGLDFPDIYNTEFIGGSGQIPPFEDFSVDSARAERIEFPPIENGGRLLGIGTLIPNDTGEVIYGFNAIYSDTSSFHGLPIGLIHHAPDYNTSVLEFPLYYVREPSSFDIFHKIMDEFGETPVGIENDGVNRPIAPELLQNYPNPFNSETIIKFRLAQSGHAVVAVYNIVGQRAAVLLDGPADAGENSVRWDAAAFPSGVYFARLNSGEIRKSVKMILLK